MIKNINLAKKKAIYDSVSHTIGRLDGIYDYGISVENDNEFILNFTYIENLQNVPIKFSEDTLKIFNGKNILKNLSKTDNTIIFMGKVTLNLKYKIVIEQEDDLKIKIVSYDFISCNNFEFSPLNAMIGTASVTEPLNFLKYLDLEIQSQSKEFVIEKLNKLKFKRHLTLEKMYLIYDELTEEDVKVIKGIQRKLKEYGLFLKKYGDFLNKAKTFDINLTNDKEDEENIENTKKAKKLCESLLNASDESEKLAKDILIILPLLTRISIFKNDLSFINKLEKQFELSTMGLIDKPATLNEYFKYGVKNGFNVKKEEIVDSLLKNVIRLLIPLESLYKMLNNVLKKDPK